MTGREELEKSLIDISKIADILQERIYKAIEYIEKQEDYFNEYPLINRKDLLDILKGGDKDE